MGSIVCQMPVARRSQTSWRYGLQAPVGHAIVKRLTVEAHRVNDLHIALPETEAFLQADLSPDTGSAMGSVERPT